MRRTCMCVRICLTQLCARECVAECCRCTCICVRICLTQLCARECVAECCRCTCIFFRICLTQLCARECVAVRCSALQQGITDASASHASFPTTRIASKLPVYAGLQITRVIRNSSTNFGRKNTREGKKKSELKRPSIERCGFQHARHVRFPLSNLSLSLSIPFSLPLPLACALSLTDNLAFPHGWHVGS